MSIYDLNDSDWLQIEQAARGMVSGSGREWPALVVAIAKIRGEPVAELCKRSAHWLTGFCEAVLAIHRPKPKPKSQEPVIDSDAVDYAMLSPGDMLQTGDEFFRTVYGNWRSAVVVGITVPDNSEIKYRRLLKINDQFIDSLNCFVPIHRGESNSVSVFYHKTLQGLFVREGISVRWMMNSTEIATVWRRSQLLQLLKNFA